MTDYYYKYRSLSNLKRFLDILIKRRLYAAKYLDLNDPMEGYFIYDNSVPQSIIAKLRNDKSSTLICSLSKTHKNGLMWSVYADEHKGCCIKLSVTSTTWKLLTVSYETCPAVIDSTKNSVEDILSRKSIQWQHEQEVRCIKVNPKNAFLRIKIDTIYLGIKVRRADVSLLEELISKIDPKIKVIKMNRNDIDFGFIL